MYAEYLNVVTVGICLCVGYILKHLVTTDKVNRWIPLIVGCLGVLITVWINMSFTPQTILIGLISGLSSTGLYEAFKKWIRGDK
jgi:Na+/glutamate symporter